MLLFTSLSSFIVQYIEGVFLLSAASSININGEHMVFSLSIAERKNDRGMLIYYV
jgi:hypothetical protein